MTKNQEDTLMKVYLEVTQNKLQNKFKKQLNRMKNQPKHQYKSIAERYEYALYRIKGGESKENY